MADEFAEPYRVPSAPGLTFSFTEILSGNSYAHLNDGIMPFKMVTYESYLVNDDGITQSLTATAWAAQTFTIGNTGTNEAFFPTKVMLKNSAGTLADVTIEMQEVTDNKPNGVIKAKWVGKFNQTEKDGGDDWWEVQLKDADFWDGEALQTNTQYALVVYRHTGVITTDFKEDSSSSTYAGGALWETADAGSNWTEQTNEDMLFEIVGSTRNPFVLSTATFTSSEASTTQTSFESGITSWTEIVTRSFEGRWNRPAILEGDAIVNFTITDTNTDDHRIKIELYHISGTTETKIAEAEAWTNATASGVMMELTQTTIAPGDFIKLKFIIDVVDASGNQVFTFNHNPNGTALTLQLPFKTD